MHLYSIVKLLRINKLLRLDISPQPLFSCAMLQQRGDKFPPHILLPDPFNGHRADVWATEDLAVSTLNFDRHDLIAWVEVVLEIVVHHCEQLIPSGETSELDAALWLQGIGFFIEVQSEEHASQRVAVLICR